MTQTTTAQAQLTVLPLEHPQGCRTYLIADPESRQALALDVHLDLVDAVAEHVRREGWTLPYVVDSHTHADHPSGAGALAALFASTRIAHRLARHAGVTRHPEDGDRLHLGDRTVTLRHAPGHTPDHLVLLTDDALFAGDTLLIGGVARTDFLGGDAGQLHDTLRSLLEGLPDQTVLYPGHDYQGRGRSTIGDERRDNPWLKMERDEFVRQLTANPPPRPANMDDLLRLNREGVDIPAAVSAFETSNHVASGGAGSVIDVRTGAEFEAEHVPGSRWIPLDQIELRADEVRAVAAPRLLLCRTGSRAKMAREKLEALHVSGLSVVEGGIEAYRSSGGTTEKGRSGMSLERQVRIGAGVLMLLSIGLGALVHPGFLGMAAIVGAGQVFAGVTNWCGMGLLLAKAPWNRRIPMDASSAAGGGACAASAPVGSGASGSGACAASAPLPSTGGSCQASPPKS